MSRQPRDFQPGYCYHVTVRCNNRDFQLTRPECKQLLLKAIKETRDKYGFNLYALCIMSNHIHYLIEPAQPEDLPKIMQRINWYSAMCFNRLLNRTGHFWEKRYHAVGFPITDKKRALNTIRYIHANPKAANMQKGFFYDFSNYGIYDRLTHDGITQWHPMFLTLGKTLEHCANAYRKFCEKYKPKPKPEKRNHWGSKKLAGIELKRKPRKVAPGQQRLPWDRWDPPSGEIAKIAETFIRANSYNPDAALTEYDLVQYLAPDR